MTETKPMSTADMPTQGEQHRVKVGDREMTLAEARAAMSPALAHQLAQRFPRASDSPALAQQMVEAYAAEHQREHGQPWTGEQPNASETQRSRQAADEREEQRQRDQARQPR